MLYISSTRILHFSLYKFENKLSLKQKQNFRINFSSLTTRHQLKIKMAFRAASQLKSMVKSGLGGRSSFATTADHLLNPAPDFKARLKKDNFVPVGISIGMITVSTSLGVYTALHQLQSAPNVRIKKSRRESIPEVVEAEHVVAEAEKFVKKSFFRTQIANQLCLIPLQVIFAQGLYELRR